MKAADYTFDLGFGDPLHGWLPITIKWKAAFFGNEMTLMASNVPNDPVAEFAELAVMIDEGNGFDRVVSVNEEPEVTKFRFVRKYKEEWVRCEISNDAPGAGRMAFVVMEMPAATIRQSIFGALMNLQQTSVVDGKLEGWRDFPSKFLSRLRSNQ